MQTRLLWPALITLAMGTGLMSQAADSPTPRVSVGPNILVSRDGDLPHVELMLAANPRNSKQMVGAAITSLRPAGGWACKTYATSDGGYVWFDSAFPDQVEWGGADPQVAFTPDGTAIFANLTLSKDEKGQIGSNLMVYRSEDGGRTWAKPVLAIARVDHPQIAVDHSGGKNNGRIYIAYLHGYPEYQISVVRSDDGGRTFGKPVLAASGRGIIGINVTSLHLLSDGTLVVPYGDFDFHQKPKPPTEATSNLWVVTSSDGGETYSQPSKVGTEFMKFEHHLGGFAMFAADTSGGAYRDRIYAAWTDYTSGSGRVTFTYSADRGRTWSKPLVVDPSGPASSVQYQVQLAVNKFGTLGLTWFDTRAAADALSQYDEYFTASVDGGAKFLKPVRISSKTSQMFGIGNMQVIPATWHHENMARISFTSPSTRWRSAGDYMGLAADNEGIFHPFWSDARSGTFQIWTTSVEVSNSPQPARMLAAEMRETDVTPQIEIVTDPARYDPVTHEMEMPLRLKNLTGRPIYPPITMSVAQFGSGMGEMMREYAPEILNANNKQRGVGAEFDYSRALGDLGVLAPEAVTDAVVLRLRIGDPEKIPDMHLSIKASVEPQPGSAKQRSSH